jgi:gamma-glutamyltranspeptidase/glutathione hydrolase
VDPAVGAAEAEGVHEGGETTHLSVVDADGNAVSLTITQGVYFGSGAFAAGTFLNSAMNLFSDDPDHPNALGPDRVPRSTTTPTILLRDGRVHMVLGSPGAGRIPPAVLQSIVYVLDYGLDPFAALSMPRVNPYFSTTEVEFEQGVHARVLAGATELGYRLTAFPPASLYFGGVHMILRRGDRWVGAADPRRDGTVTGY